MEKSLHAPDYVLLIAMMREAREGRGFTQDKVAAKLKISASQLSKWERRERRVDARELRLYCQAIGMPLAEFIESWEKALKDPRSERRD